MGDILLFAIFAFIGNLLFSVGMLQVLITVFCAIPATIKISRETKIDHLAIYLRCLFTMVFWSIISYILITLAIKHLSAPALNGLWTGLGFACLLSLGKWGMTEGNMEDYYRTFKSELGDYLEPSNSFWASDFKSNAGLAKTKENGKTNEGPDIPVIARSLQERAIYIVKYCASKSDLGLREYCVFAMIDTAKSEGMSEFEAKGFAEGWASSQPNLNLMCMDLIKRFAQKSNMSPEEYINHLESKIR
jgi:uncharacterized protein with PQ loop repeat